MQQLGLVFKTQVNIYTPTPCNEIIGESLKVPQQYPTFGSTQKLRDIYNSKNWRILVPNNYINRMKY